MRSEKATEIQEQQAIIEWAEYMSGQFPELRRLYHVPNGGLRNPVTAGLMKKMGVKSGVPDLHLPIQRGGFAGLYIEIKTRDGKPSPAQLDWLKALNDEGYCALVAWGAEHGILLLREYLQGNLVRKAA